MAYTEADFERLSWHDCAVWGIEVRAGEPDEGDWTSDLALDLDYIVEWVGGAGAPVRFRVAPATLVFHGVTDPRIAVDWGPSSHQVAIHPMAIDRIERAPLRDQRVYLDRPYYRWTIRLNWPQGGEIVLGAVGFTQTLRAEPALVDRQSLSRRERARLVGAANQETKP